MDLCEFAVDRRELLLDVDNELGICPRQGFEIAEAYPRQEAQNEAANYHGPLAMYLAAGFEPVREADGIVIVRKTLLS